MPRFLDVSNAVAARNVVNIARAGKTLYAEDYRDGIRTDNEILAAVFNDLDAGGAVRLGQGTTYTLTEFIQVDLTNKPDVLIDGQGATIQATAAVPGVLFRPRGVEYQTKLELTAAITSRTDTLTVADVGAAQAGDLVAIRSDAEVFNTDGEGANRFKQEMARVKSVPDSTTIVLDGRTWNTYSLTGYEVEVQLYRPMRNLTVRDLNFVGSGTGEAQTLIQPAFFDNVTLDNITARDAGQAGIDATRGMNFTAVACTATDCNNNNTGYGMHVDQTHGAKFLGCYGTRNRHSFDAHLSRDILIQGCTAEHDRSAGISTHGAVDAVRIIDNIVRDCGGGIIVRSANNIIRGNHIISSKDFDEDSQTYYHGIVVGAWGTDPGTGVSGTNLIIDGNYIDVSGPTWENTDNVNAIRLECPLVDARIVGNIGEGFSGSGIFSRADYNTNVVIADNILNCSAQLFTNARGIELAPQNTDASCVNTNVTIERNVLTGTVLHSGIYVKGGPTSGTRTDKIRIMWNQIPACGTTPINLSSGYYGSDVTIVGNETADTKAVTLTAANWTVPPYIGSHGYAKTPQVLGVGQELGARMRNGFYYGPGGSVSSSVTSTINRLFALPIFIPRRVSVDRIGVNITVAAAASSVARLAIYADIDDGMGGLPGALVTGSDGTVDTDSTGFKEATIDVTLNPGLYWLAYVAQGGTPNTGALTSNSQMVGYWVSAATVAQRSAYSRDSVTGAVPDPFTPQNSHGSAPYVQIRVSSTSTL